MNIGIAIRDRFGQDVFGTNTYYYDTDLNLEKGKKYRCLFNLDMNISAGKYTVTTAVHTKDTHLEHCFHWIDNAIEFEVAGNHGYKFIGICKLYPVIKFEQEYMRV